VELSYFYAEKVREILDNYEKIIKTISLTADEVELLVEMLECKPTVCRGEEITVEGLLEKLE